MSPLKSTCWLPKSVKDTFAFGLLLILLTAGRGLPVTAQELPHLVWAKEFSTDDLVPLAHLAVDGSGAVYCAGTFTGTIDLDPGPGTTTGTSIGYSTYIMKLNASGDLLWARVIPGDVGTAAYSIVADASGDIYLTGEYYETTDFDPGSGVFNLTPNGDRDAFVLKLSADGDFVWAISVGGTEPDNGITVAVDPAGFVIMSGVFSGAVDFDPGPGNFTLISPNIGDYTIFIIKLDATDGTFVWAKTIGDGGLDQGRALVVDAMSNVYLSGDFDGGGDFDPGPGSFPLTSEGYLDLFLLKLNAAGDFVYAKQMGGTGYFGTGYALAFDPAGDILITGMFEETMDFDPGPGTLNLTAVGATDGFICKVDTDGNLIWVRAFGGLSYEESYQISIDAAGDATVSGIYSDTGDFDPGPGIFTLTSNGVQEIFLLQLDTDGNFNWATSIGGAGYDAALGLVIDPSGNLLLTGQIQEGIVDVDPQSTVVEIGNATTPTTFILKYGEVTSEGIVVYNAVSPNKDGKNEILYISNIDGASTKDNRLTILDRWGSVVFEADNYDNSTHPFRGQSTEGTDLPSGTYYYKLEFKGSGEVQTGFLSLRR